MASKRQNAPSEEADSCQVRSNALGAFKRTHGRMQEQGSNASQPALAVICVRTQGTCGPTHIQSALISRVALAGPIVHRFKLAPWAVMCVRLHIVRSNALAVEPSAYTRTHAARSCICGRTRTRTSNACSSAFERNSLRSNAPLTWQHVLFCL
jgi:hypothetical protein